MNVIRVTIDHVRVVADKPFDKVTPSGRSLPPEPMSSTFPDADF